MNIKITDNIQPLFTTYYTLMGRNAFDNLWIHLITSEQKEFVEKYHNPYEYHKLIEFELETYNDEQLYQLYYRQKKLGRITDDSDDK